MGHGKVYYHMAKCIIRVPSQAGCQKKNVTDTYFIDITTKADIFTRKRFFSPKTLTTNCHSLELKLPFKALFLKHDIGMHDFTLH